MFIPPLIQPWNSTIKNFQRGRRGASVARIFLRASRLPRVMLLQSWSLQLCTLPPVCILHRVDNTTRRYRIIFGTHVSHSECALCIPVYAFRFMHSGPAIAILHTHTQPTYVHSTLLLYSFVRQPSFNYIISPFLDRSFSSFLSPTFL